MIILILRSILPWVALVHAALFILFWLTNGLFAVDINNVLVGVFGAKQDYVRLFILAAAGIALWSAARLVGDRLRWTHPLSEVTLWLYAGVALVFLIFFYASFAVLFHEAPAQGVRLGQFLGYFRIFLDALLLLGVAATVGRWLRSAAPASSLAPVAGLVVLGLLWAVPMVYFPPGSVYRDRLPEKPQIVAHRGAAALAPENTLTSARLAADLGVYGLETDIHFSRDGVPYLMHDATLRRTTDVAQVFPGREKERDESFSLAELRQLSAGSWFAGADPYGAIASGAVSKAQAEAYRDAQVPTLAEELEIVHERKLVFIFDLNRPPQDHPDHDSYFDVCLAQLQQAGVDPQVWFLASPDQLPVLRAKAPQMLPAYGGDYRQMPAAAELKAAGYRVVNAEFGLAASEIRAYQAAGLWVNLWTVDETWQYSRLWLLGVDSTTTNRSRELLALARPVFALAYSTYTWLWAGLGVAALAVMMILK